MNISATYENKPLTIEVNDNELPISESETIKCKTTISAITFKVHYQGNSYDVLAIKQFEEDKFINYSMYTVNLNAITVNSLGAIKPNERVVEYASGYLAGYLQRK